jgi:tetratricopeptide (TPR) repeat protein
MGLFDVFRSKGDLERLEREASINPTAANLTTLAERHLAGGDIERALVAARRAVDEFPDSEMARNTYQTIRRLQMQNRIRDLQRRIAGQATAADFEILVNLYYRELRDRDKALEITRQGLERFPQSEGLHFLDGQIRFDRFHEDFTARDGAKTIEHLQTAARLNPQNYKAHLLLARLYGSLGLTRQAQEAIAALRRLIPDDETARSLETAVARPPLYPDPDDALHAAEVRRGFPTEFATIASLHGAKLPSATPPADAGRLQAALKSLLAPPWALGAFAFSGDGRPISYEVRPELDGATWQQALLALHRAAEDASRRMDIGGFHSGTLVCLNRRVHLYERGNAILALVTRANSRTNDAESALAQAAESI